MFDPFDLVILPIVNMTILIRVALINLLHVYLVTEMSLKHQTLLGPLSPQFLVQILINAGVSVCINKNKKLWSICLCTCYMYMKGSYCLFYFHNLLAVLHSIIALCMRSS